MPHLATDLILIGCALLFLIGRGYGPFWKRLGHASIWSILVWAGSVRGGFVDPFVIAMPGCLFLGTYVVNAFRDQVEDYANGRLLGIKNPSDAYCAIALMVLGSYLHEITWQAVVLWLLTEVYSLPALGRLKRWGWAQMILEGLAAGICFSLCGVWDLWTIVVGSVRAIGCIIKDVDDMAGDRLAGNKTFCVWLSHRIGDTAVRRWVGVSYLVASGLLIGLVSVLVAWEGGGLWMTGLPLIWVAASSLRWNAESLVIWANATVATAGWLIWRMA